MQVGDKVKVVRKGLMSSDWVGVVIEEGLRFARVKFPDRRNPLNYNKQSLEVIKEDKFVEVTKPIFEINKPLVVAYMYKGTFRSSVARIRGFNEEGISFNLLGGDRIPYKDIIMMVGCDQRIEFHKPNPNRYPFWLFPKEEMTLKIFKLEMHGGELTAIVDGAWMLPTAWISPDVNIKGYVTEKVKVEPVPEPLEVGVDELEADYRLILNEKLSEKEMKEYGMSFAVYLTDKHSGKSHLYMRNGAACHWAMKLVDREYNFKSYTPHFGIQYITKDYHNSNVEDKKVIEEWTKWVMNDSPWSRYCITKSWDEALRYGIKVRLNIPSNAMMCTFYALRYPTEFMEGKVKPWFELVSGGMNPQLAYFFAETDELASDTLGHHQLLNTHRMDIECLIKFIKCEEGPTKTDIYLNTGMYSDVSIHHGKRNNINKTAVKELRNMDIFNDEVKVGGIFGGGVDKRVNTKKLIEAVDRLIAGA